MTKIINVPVNKPVCEVQGADRGGVILAVRRRLVVRHDTDKSTDHFTILLSFGNKLCRRLHSASPNAQMSRRQECYHCYMLHMYESDALRGTMLSMGVGIKRLSRITGYSENDIRMMTLGVMPIPPDIWRTLNGSYGAVEHLGHFISARCDEGNGVAIDDTEGRAQAPH